MEHERERLQIHVDCGTGEEVERERERERGGVVFIEARVFAGGVRGPQRCGGENARGAGQWYIVNVNNEMV